MGGHAKGLLQETAIRHRAVPFVRNLSESKKKYRKDQVWNVWFKRKFVNILNYPHNIKNRA